MRALVALDELGLHDERRDVVDGVAAFGAHLKFKRSFKISRHYLNDIFPILRFPRLTGPRLLPPPPFSPLLVVLNPPIGVCREIQDIKLTILMCI